MPSGDEMQARVVASRALLERCVQLLECAFEGVAQSDLGQPTSAVSWLEDFVQAFLLRVHALCVVTPACKWGVDVAKSWMFASSSPLLQALAGSCSHGRDAHESIAGKRDSFGGFVSQQSATYPVQLASAYAAALGSLLQAPQPCSAPLLLSAALSQIPVKPQTGPLTATQDGGGISSVPDWSSPPLGVKDIMQDLRLKLRAWLLQANVACRLQALLGGTELEALFSVQEVPHARSIFADWMLSEGFKQLVSWECSEGQPYALHALLALSKCLQDKDSALFPA